MSHVITPLPPSPRHSDMPKLLLHWGRSKDDRHVGGVEQWPGHWLDRPGNSNPNSLSWLLPHGAQHTPLQVLTPLQGNRSLPKEAQGSHYITLQTGWGGR